RRVCLPTSRPPPTSPLFPYTTLFRSYYDESGALRDMIQNHMLQLLCLVAMEPPASDDANALRDEKLKVLRALRPIVNGEVARETDRKSTRLNSSHVKSSYAVFCLKKK